MTMLREFVSNRGVAMPTSSRELRRPRTCFFTAERPTTTSVDAVWEFENGGERGKTGGGTGRCLDVHVHLIYIYHINKYIYMYIYIYFSLSLYIYMHLCIHGDMRDMDVDVNNYKYQTCPKKCIYKILQDQITIYIYSIYIYMHIHCVFGIMREVGLD